MLTLETTPEIEELVQAEARKRGLKVDEYALQVFLNGLNQSKPIADEEFEAALDEAIAFFDDLPFGTKELRALKEEEMELEEAKHQRLFGKGKQ